MVLLRLLDLMDDYHINLGYYVFLKSVMRRLIYYELSDNPDVWFNIFCGFSPKLW